MNRAIRGGYDTKLVNGQSIKVYKFDASDLIKDAVGTTAASNLDSQSGFAKGALYTKSDAATGVKSLYENIGTTASSSFNLIGDVTAGEIALVEGSILVGNSSGVATAVVAKTSGRILVGDGTTTVLVAVSGDATLASSGAVTVTGANAAFNVGTNVTMAKEVNHTVSVTTTTTAATVGGSLTVSAGQGATSGAGGAYASVGGAGGTTGIGGAASLTSGAGGATSGASGDVTVASGTTTAGAGSATGSVTVQSGAGAASAVAVAGGASGAVVLRSQAGGANTGGASGQVGGAAGAISVTGGAGGATNSQGAHAGGAGATVSVTAGAGGNATAGTGAGGAGGSLEFTPGTGGTSSGGAAGINGLLFQRGPVANKFTVTAMTDTATIAASGIIGGMITCTPTAAANYTMPTGTVLAAALPATFTTGDSVDFVITNIATNDTFDITVLTAASGITLKTGYVVIEANSAATKLNFGVFRCIKTGANTFDVYRLS